MILHIHYKSYCFSEKGWLSIRVITAYNRYAESIRRQNPPEILLNVDASVSIRGNRWKQGPGRRFTTHQDSFPNLHVIVMGWEDLLI